MMPTVADSRTRQMVVSVSGLFLKYLCGLMRAEDRLVNTEVFPQTTSTSSSTLAAMAVMTCGVDILDFEDPRSRVDQPAFDPFQILPLTEINLFEKI